jgi:hypothetical protein
MKSHESAARDFAIDRRTADSNRSCHSRDGRAFGSKSTNDGNLLRCEAQRFAVTPFWRLLADRLRAARTLPNACRPRRTPASVAAAASPSAASNAANLIASHPQHQANNEPREGPLRHFTPTPRATLKRSTQNEGE